MYPLYALGRWDEALALAADVPDEAFVQTRFPFMCLLGPVVSIHLHRGDVEAAARLTALHPEIRDSDDLTERAAYVWAEALLLLASGDAAGALRAAETSWDMRVEVGISSEASKEAYVVAVDAALALGDNERAGRLIASVEEMEPGTRPQSMAAHAMRHRALLAAAAGEQDRAEQLFRRASALFRELAMPFPMAVTMLEHGEWLSAAGIAAEAAVLRAGAGEVFGSLEARPWLDRLDRAPGEAVSA